MGVVPFEDMLFFDDEARNRDVEVELSVTFWLVRDGISREEVDKGVWEWRKRRGIYPEGGQRGRAGQGRVQGQGQGQGEELQSRGGNEF